MWMWDGLKLPHGKVQFRSWQAQRLRSLFFKIKDFLTRWAIVIARNKDTCSLEVAIKQELWIWVRMKFPVLWYTTSCKLVYRYQHFGGKHCLCRQGSSFVLNWFKVAAFRSFEMLLATYKFTWRHSTKDESVHQKRCGISKICSYKFINNWKLKQRKVVSWVRS